MADRKTAIGKVLADIDAEISSLRGALALVGSKTPEEMQARIDELQRTRDLVAKHERPAVERKPRAEGATPRKRKAS